MSIPTFIPFSPSPTVAQGLTSPQMADPKEKFFRHFQAEITLIQDEIDSLATMSPIGGERQSGIDKVLAGISRLSNEVMDATDFIPSYDQRAYSQVGTTNHQARLFTYTDLGNQSPDREAEHDNRQTWTEVALPVQTPEHRGSRITDGS
ncbi:hypothetical protein NUW58_g10624 [Xylaria curta]|uniref:Uncharacterized protein n=1 Tax=Xylaria curta TaxID=42375 RepID=A0ACC1MJ06_9PEZI|nr:hypothetical protein NUW58_g10624 [Xylaria curta]